MKSVHVSLLAGHDIWVKKHHYKHMSKESEVLADYMTHAAGLLTIDPNLRLEQENAQLRKNRTNYLAELGDLREEFNEMEKTLTNLDKGT